MALLRKDLKLGFLAGGIILVLGVGYLLVSSFLGSDDPPPTDPLAFEPTLSQPPEGGDSDSGNDASASSGNDSSDDWGDFGQPTITRTPTPSELASGTLPPDAPIEPTTPNINEDAVADDAVNGRTILTELVSGARDQAATASATESAAGTGASTPASGTPPAEAGAARTHKVASGENLSAIAEKYYGDPNLFSLIQDANPAVDSRRLAVGQVLQIPDRAAAELEKASTVSTPAPGDDAPSDAASTEAGVHVVRSGETLSSIANRLFGRAALWQDIYDLNRDVIGGDPANLKVGMKLKLPK